MKKFKILFQPRAFLTTAYHKIDRIFDRAYGIDTFDRANPTPYFWLRRIRNALRLRPADSILDVGCGSGRALWYLSRRGQRARGIELDPQLATRARKNVSNATIEVVDATVAEFNGETLIYLANPFGFNSAVMLTFLRRLIDDVARHPRPVRLCYLHPLLDLSPIAQLKPLQSVKFLHTTADIYQVEPSPAPLPQALRRHPTYRSEFYAGRGAD